MVKNSFAATILIAFITLGFFKVGETQVQSSNAKFSSESSKIFNPFDLRCWYDFSSQFLQFWFPYFQHPYYPPNVQRPTTAATTSTTPAPVSQVQTEKNEENTKPNNNIFGMGPVDDTVPYLPPPNEIEW